MLSDFKQDKAHVPFHALPGRQGEKFSSVSSASTRNKTMQKPFSMMQASAMSTASVKTTKNNSLSIRGTNEISFADFLPNSILNSP